MSGVRGGVSGLRKVGEEGGWRELPDPERREGWFSCRWLFSRLSKKLVTIAGEANGPRKKDLRVVNPSAITAPAALSTVVVW